MADGHGCVIITHYHGLLTIVSRGLHGGCSFDLSGDDQHDKYNFSPINKLNMKILIAWKITGHIQSQKWQSLYDSLPIAFPYPYLVMTLTTMGMSINMEDIVCVCTPWVWRRELWSIKASVEISLLIYTALQYFAFSPHPPPLFAPLILLARLERVGYLFGKCAFFDM